ncbi:MAG: hypothetical protein NT094_01550, partial [Candidatus Staskawiczbacteria bacterium]|nr:hypothetical protein [Candidatus Staskawiczbacteria bacterium]
MEKNKNILVLSLISVVVTALAVVAVVNAATTLTPPGAPAGTMYTLEDIYNSIPAAPIWQPADSVISLPWNANNCIDPNTSDNTCSDIKGDGSLLLGATEFCAYLNTAGTAINCAGDPLTCAPVNYWRLPTEGELLK